MRFPKLALAAMLLLNAACDPPKTGPAQTTTVETEEPFSITPALWGATSPTVNYEVRELPDGAPGLFDPEGRLLLELLPQLVVDAGPAGKPRPRPTTRKFELVKLTPNTEGGFTMFGRIKDANAAYDLRVENGPNDPRIHVGVTTKWARDVTVHREVLRFRTGAVGDATALAHDYTWAPVEDEWVGPLHAPPIVRWEALSAIGRIGAQNIAARRSEDRWEVELEIVHHENHPVEQGEGCDEQLDGAAPYQLGERLEMRADFVVGELAAPLVARYPHGRAAAISLVDTADGAARAFVRSDVEDAGPPKVVTRQNVWLGASVEDLPCANGRFVTLSESGVTAMWSGHTMVSSGANLLAPTETDGRRAFAFAHPGVAVGTLFSLSDGEPDPGWLDPAAVARLKTDRGIVVINEPLDQFLSKDASAMKTVRDAATALAADDTVWLTDVGELASRLVAVAEVDIDVLPQGVIRVRNVSDRDITGLTLLLPDGTKVRYDTGVEHQSSGRTTWFDLAAESDQLLQLFRGDEPAWAMLPAQIVVADDGAAPQPSDVDESGTTAPDQQATEQPSEP